MIRRKLIKHDLKKMFPVLKKELEKEKDVIFAYIFGSYAEGREGPLSDFDIAIFLKNTSKDFFERKIGLNNLVTSILKTDEVDIVILNEANVEISFNIIKNGFLFISKDEKSRIEYEKKIIKYYMDFEYYRRRMIKEFFSKVKRELKIE
jgi:hypothetical protein